MERLDYQEHNGVVVLLYDPHNCHGTYNPGTGFKTNEWKYGGIFVPKKSG